jgi:hypothetical protein
LRKEPLCTVPDEQFTTCCFK